QPARRRRADRDQLLPEQLQRARSRTDGGPRRRTRRRELLLRPHDVHRQRGQDLAEAHAGRGPVHRPVRPPAPEVPRLRRPHARALPRDGPAGGAALSGAAPGRAADRTAQRAGEADQRAALRLRRPAHPVARRDLAQLPARVARPARDAVRRRPRARRQDDGAAAPMDQRLTPPHYQAAGSSIPGLDALLRAFGLVRYRFFLYAGLLPYLLGAAWAYAVGGAFDGPIFWSGFGGVVLAVIGVEAFNEYFDSRMGTDRVFNPADLPPMSDAVLWLGVIAFAAALAVGAYLTVRGGWPVLALALLGGAAAIFYVAP